jgi:hypothetical protein
MKRLCVLLLLAACGSPTAYSTTVGTLQPHERITVRVAGGTVNVYAPLIGQAANTYTIQAFATGSQPPPTPRVRPVRGGIAVDASVLRSLLVRVPKGVDVVIVSGNGDVNVTDISGTATVALARGNASLMLPRYGQAAISGSGRMKVLVGSSTWPGTLRFSDARGNIDLSINENAKFRVRLHTDDGTIFTDFPLRGTSHGSAETIDGVVNGGAARSVDVEATAGTIRLLSLAPQY